MPEPSRAIFLTQVGSTLALVGVIWMVQLVHYPLFARVGDAAFPAYEAAHTRSITWVVGPLMLAEVASALLLLVDTAGRGPRIPEAERWVGLGLVAAIWISTAVLQVPQHTRLSGGFDADAHRFLVASNWVRTVAWTVRGGLVLSWVARSG